MKEYDISIGQMLVSAPNIIYTINNKIEIYKGRVVTAGLQPNALLYGTFRIYSDLEKFRKDGDYVEFKEIPIRAGEFKVIGIQDLNSSAEPSTIETLVDIYLEISKIEVKADDLGIINSILPERLRAFKKAVSGYITDNPSAKNDVIDILLDASISDCSNCPVQWGTNLAEDEWYKKRTITLAKNNAKTSINLLFYPWGGFK